MEKPEWDGCDDGAWGTVWLIVLLYNCTGFAVYLFARWWALHSPVGGMKPYHANDKTPQMPFPPPPEVTFSFAASGA